MIVPPLILGSAGIILGFVGRARAKEGAEHGSLATWAIALGIVALVLAVVLFLVVVALPVSFGGSSMGEPIPVN